MRVMVMLLTPEQCRRTWSRGSRRCGLASIGSFARGLLVVEAWLTIAQDLLAADAWLAPAPVNRLLPHWDALMYSPV